jgi:signal peptidase I
VTLPPASDVARTPPSSGSSSGAGWFFSGPPPVTPPAGAEGKRRAGGRRGRWLIEIAIIVAAALLLAVVLRTFVVQTFYIPSGSMEPTLQIGDRILVDKLSYHLHGVHRGDIVVFQRPPSENCGGPAVNDLVKRVIGLPGDTLTLANGHVVVNGKQLSESWLPSVDQGQTTDQGNPPYNLTHPFKVPPGEYFLMGDNRMQSCDSRYWGPIPKSLIVGRVVVRVWPLSHIRFF